MIGRLRELVEIDPVAAKLGGRQQQVPQPAALCRVCREGC